MIDTGGIWYICCLKYFEQYERRNNMDTIFLNGNVCTMDEHMPEAQAVAVKNGVITAVGSNEEVMAENSAVTEIIDLGGCMLLPGFTDSHLHLMAYAAGKRMVDLSDAESLEDVCERCAAPVSEMQQTGEWIQGLGFNQDNWSEKVIPTRKDLDRVSTEVPIVIRRACFHLSVCNTKAMENIGLMEPDGESNELGSQGIGYYADGTPNGILYEDTQNLVNRNIPRMSVPQLKELILEGLSDVAAQGITEIHTDDFMSGYASDSDFHPYFQAYCELADEGKLPVRVYQQCSLWSKKDLEGFLAEGHRTGEEHGLYRLGPLKLIVDGSLGAHTAKLKQPYKNDPSANGCLNHSGEELYILCKLAQEKGMQIAAHCIGDGAIQVMLEVYKKIQQEHPGHDMRHGIVHCQIMDARQQDEMRRQGLLAYVQPVFLRSDMNIVEKCVGQRLASQSYGWRRLADLGVHLSGGSDCPVEPFDILPNLEYAVTRTNPDTGQSFYPENGLEIDEALRMFTLEGAYASFSEDNRGSITVGKNGDLTVLDRDLRKRPEEEIHMARVLMTMVQGRIVYRADW